MIETLFSTFIYHENLQKNSSSKRVNKDLVFECLRFSEIDLLGKKWSKKNYPGGYTSYGSLSQLHKISTTFEELEKQIDRHIAKFIRYLEMDIKPKDLKMTTCWINIMPTQVTHSMHIHPLSVLSGTYYVSTPKNCSKLKFEDPRLVNFMASPPRKALAQPKNQRFFQFSPTAGQVVLFESWTRHEVVPNQSKMPRISISFNYDWG